MSNRRDFLKQLGLLSVAVGSGLSLPALAPRTRWCGLPIPLLTEAQKDAVVRGWTGHFHGRIHPKAIGLEDLSMNYLLPEGVRFLQRKEFAWDDRWGIALRVERHGHRVKHALGWEPPDIMDPGYETRSLCMAVDLLCGWYDHTGCEMIALPEAKVVVYTPEQLQHMGEA